MKTQISYALERRLLQSAIALGGLVPAGGGLFGMLHGAAMFGEGEASALDSHVRYLSGLLFGIGLLFWSCIPSIEMRTGRIRALVLLVVLGGLARAAAALRFGAPDAVSAFALGMELGFTPVVGLWQHRIARRSRPAPA